MAKGLNLCVQRDESNWIDIVPWQRSDAVKPDPQPNALMVTARGATPLFQVNGATVAGLTYDKLPNAGGLGIFVGGDFNQVALEQLRITNAD